MAKFQTKDWISLVLYIIAIILIFFNIAYGTENAVLGMSGWIMMMIASLHMIFTNVKRVNPKDESGK